MNPFSKILFLSGAIFLLGASCIQFKGGGGAKGLDGAVWRTVDRGENWAQRAIVPTPRGIVSMGGTNISALAVDPQDRRAIYTGTEENGMYYSYDGGEGWTQATGLTGGRVAAIAVDSRDKCTIHVAIGNRIMRSIDCNRTWQNTYVDSRNNQFMMSLITDPRNSSILYAGISTGDLFRSVDGGGSWAALHRFDSRVWKVAVNKNNSATIYVATTDGGLFRSGDGGLTWVDYNRAWQKFFGARTILGLVQLPDGADAWLVATRYGMLKTSDGGATWEEVPLLTKANSVTITTLTVDPKNGRNIYYTTANTFYRTQDGGATWVTRKIPSSRIPRALMVDAEDGHLIYLGVAAVKK